MDVIVCHGTLSWFTCFKSPWYAVAVVAAAAAAAPDTPIPEHDIYCIVDDLLRSFELNFLLTMIY